MQRDLLGVSVFLGMGKFTLEECKQKKVTGKIGQLHQRGELHSETMPQSK